MNPIQITNTLQVALVDYLTTIFDVNRDGQEPELAAAVRANLSTPGALFAGPYLEIAPPYRKGCTVTELCEGVLNPEVTRLPCFVNGNPIGLNVPLYLHQERAITRIVNDERGVVVSSGTGSGKTECFLIPILSDLLSDSDPGVRAVLIYPLNALVNDQLDRLRKLLAGTPFTFGRYTSELAETTKDALSRMSEAAITEYERNDNEVISREQIRSGDRLPQILITNYAMLEYLLLRPEDSILFKNGRWRFVVLDEAHTYQGAQGIEVAMLLRRLKHRLGKQEGETRYIATSATLTGDDAQKAAQFATDLFGETFTAEDVVFGEVEEQFVPEAEATYEMKPEALLDDLVPVVLDELRQSSVSADTERLALSLEQIGLIAPDSLDQADLPTEQFLYRALQGNEHLSRLRYWMMERRDEPAHVLDAAQYLFEDAIHDPDARVTALYRLIELGAMAREKADSPSLLPARYHLFARPPQGVWVCINPQCPGRTTTETSNWSRMFAHRHEKCDACGCNVYPVVICRDCGQVYLRAYAAREQGDLLLPPPDDLSDEDEKYRYLAWKQVAENRALAETSSDDDEAEDALGDSPDNFRFDGDVLCLRCGRPGSRCQCGESAQHVNVWHVMSIEHSKRGVRTKPVERLEQCPRCRATAQKGTEIVTTVSVGGVTPLALLTYELYRQLPESGRDAIRSKPGAGRKLLTFYDSRQGAARFAAFLQDVVNLQNYRHIILKAVQQHESKEDFLPTVETIARLTSRLGQSAGVFHNDPESQLWRSGTKALTGEKKKALQINMATRILAEFTTNRDDRKSLERLGLVGITYFEPENEPDFSTLGKATSLSPEAARTLVCYLLDNLRKGKSITLPDGVEPDNQLFGRNISNPAVVRSRSGGSEVVWIGSTPRHRNRRLVQSVLRRLDLPADDNAVVQTLTALWEWVTHDDVGILVSQGAGSYKINHENIFLTTQVNWHRCTKCLRLSAHGGALPCPVPDCGGALEPFEPQQAHADNYFFGTYQRDVLPMRVEEHTAQLDSLKGREYQDGFRDGDINALSCSTTFEMGIDLGDLQAVVMNNVPPTVANYRQRSGRAGRRASGTALILTWASERPHDQHYFRNPPEIIRGHVRVPYINLNNAFVRQRHINAVLLSLYFRYLYEAGRRDLRLAGSFFDMDVADTEPHFSRLHAWTELRSDEIAATLEALSAVIDLPYSPDWVDRFLADMAEANNEYQVVAKHYRDHFELARTMSADLAKAKEALPEMERYRKLLDRLREERLIDYLSGRGALPSYAFPLHSVELMLPFKYGDEKLRLERDLRQSIREYAPGAEVVADKRVWLSSGLQFFRETPKVTQYRICKYCGHLELPREAGMDLVSDGTCRVCGTELKPALRYLTPDGFRAHPTKSGKPAGQYVTRQPAIMRSALIPVTDLDEIKIGSIVYAGYRRDGELLYVNEGAGRAFRLCMRCGTRLDREDKKCSGRYRGEDCPGDRIETVALGHRLKTDTLHLRFEQTPTFAIPDWSQTSFWLSLTTALIQGASRALQIERRDIGGVLSPRFIPESGTWVQTIVLFDDVPGGAGHVQQIEREFAAVVREALRVVNCTDCAEDTSCYRCLRDYSNQDVHRLLVRREAARFLLRLHDDLDERPADELHINPVIAGNLPIWLMQKIGGAKQHLFVAADALTLESPLGAAGNWLDGISDLVRRNVQVDLVLQKVPDVNLAAGLSIANQLKSLMERGLSLWQSDRLPEWPVIIDPTAVEDMMAIRAGDRRALLLNRNTGEAGLKVTIEPDHVQAGVEAFGKAMRRVVTAEQLNPPPGIEVIQLPRTPGERLREEDLFGDVFAKPIRQMIVNDPYLVDYERIVRRLGAYIELASRGGALERVSVTARKAGQGATSGSWEDQKSAEEHIRSRFGDIVHFRHPTQPDHDRYIEVERVDGERARILIGQGLDFIQPDGSLKRTYVVIQDPL